MEPLEIIPNETVVKFNGVEGLLDDDGTFHPGHGPGEEEDEETNAED